MMRLAPWNLIAFAMFLALTSCSRGPQGPDTIPVTGQIIFTRGGPAKILADRQGIIEFESIAQPGVFAYGDIQEDGRFELATVTDNVKKSGAVLGEHRVRLRLDESAGQFVDPQFVDWHQKKITITGPNEHVQVEVWR